MKALHHKVNIVPIIAKADTLTLNEVKSLKQKVIKETKLAITHYFFSQAPGRKRYLRNIFYTLTAIIHKLLSVPFVIMLCDASSDIVFQSHES